MNNTDIYISENSHDLNYENKSLSNALSEFNEILHMAAFICETPFSFIYFNATNIQWNKNYEQYQMTIPPASCKIDYDQDPYKKIEMVADALLLKNSSLILHPFLIDKQNIRFYITIPIVAKNRKIIGTFCAYNTKPQTLLEMQVSQLISLAKIAGQLYDMNFQIQNLITQNLKTQNINTDQKTALKMIALENTSEGVLLVDAQAKIVDYNRAALIILGKSKEQLTEKNLNDFEWNAIREDGSFLPREEHPSILTIKTKLPQKNITVGIRNDRYETKWLQINTTPIFHPKGRHLTNFIICFSDITTQINHQKIISQNKNYLQKILDALPSMIGHWDKNLINLNANKIYRDFFGKTPEEIKGIHIKDLLGSEIYHKNLPYLLEVLNGKPQIFERQLHIKNSLLRDTIAYYIPEFENGEVISFYVIVTDITDVKNLERDRQNLQAQLIEAAKLTTLGEMAGGIAHEINNPLAIIKGKTANLKYNLEEGPFDKEKALREFAKIEMTIDRIAKIIKGLRSYSRNAEADPFEKAKLTDIVLDTLELCKERFKKNNISIHFDYSYSICDFIIECRPSQISQVLLNLLNNSCDAILSEPDKWVKIHMQHLKNFTIEIVFSDSGHGISPEIINKIMQPFFTTKEVGKGTGLGLSISKGIIENHGGRFYVDQNSLNTCFKIELPVTHTTI